MSDETKSTLLVLNGPNLNLLGTREPEIYGHTKLADIESNTTSHAKKQGYAIDFRQTNHEGVLLDWIQEAPAMASGIVLNAGALTHTSIALHDVIAAIDVPVIEVHISNVYARENFRHHSYISDVAAGVLCGFGPHGYILAIDALASMLRNQS